MHSARCHTFEEATDPKLPPCAYYYYRRSLCSASWVMCGSSCCPGEHQGNWTPTNSSCSLCGQWWHRALRCAQVRLGRRRVCLALPAKKLASYCCLDSVLYAILLLATEVSTRVPATEEGMCLQARTLVMISSQYMCRHLAARLARAGVAGGAGTVFCTSSSHATATISRPWAAGAAAAPAVHLRAVHLCAALPVQGGLTAPQQSAGCGGGPALC